MKFAKIKTLIYSSDCDRIVDRSGSPKSYVGANRPLWFILENKRLDLRIWVTKDFGNLSITTAKLSADIKSSEYSESHQCYPFDNQKEMVRKLEEMFTEEMEAA